jgi:transposase InsO family protein
MDLKEEFVIQAQKGTVSFSALCSEYGISRKTGYKWLSRFTEEGFSGLEDQSTRPKASPDRLNEDTVCRLIRIKKDHMNWGPKKIHAIYLRGASEPISLSSVKRILEKSGYTEKRKRKRFAVPERINTRYEVKAPNDVWTVDFKGWWYAKDRSKCEPLTIRDEFSCYLLEARILSSTRTEDVKAAFERVFRLYGLPQVIRSDNGSPFASARGIRGLTRLSVWWVSLGIALERIDPGKPSQNGGHERMHRDLKADIQKQVHGSGVDIQKSLDVWRDEFNRVRPHEKLEMKTPASVYSNSSRRYHSGPVEIEYPPFYRTRKISKIGNLKIDRADI